jgi:hypothetical protein
MELCFIQIVAAVEAQWHNDNFSGEGLFEFERMQTAPFANEYLFSRKLTKIYKFNIAVIRFAF